MNRISRDTETDEKPSNPDTAPLPGRIRRGAEGGALATLVMTAYRLPVSRSLPPTAEFWSKYGPGDGRRDDPVIALLLHWAYGVGAGIAFALAFSARESVETESPIGPPSPAGEIWFTVLGLLYGAGLSIVGEKVVLQAMLDIDPDDRFAFHVGHVLYGITLGAWVGTRTSDR